MARSDEGTDGGVLEPPKVRGQRFEDYVRGVLSRIRGLTFVDQDFFNFARSQEIDLGFLNSRHAEGLHNFSPHLIVECKNWRHRVGAEQVGWFAYKVRQVQQATGILVAANGLTGDADNGTAAMAEIDAARKQEPPVNVIVVTGAELEAFAEPAALADLLRRKMFYLAASGRVFNGLERVTTPEPPRLVPEGRAGPEPVGSPGLRALNAQFLRAEDVAANFVRTPGSDFLVASGNAIVVGARGFGKTTLLKMMERTLLEQAVSDITTLGRGPSRMAVYLRPDRAAWRLIDTGGAGAVEASAVAVIFGLDALTGVIRIARELEARLGDLLTHDAEARFVSDLSDALRATPELCTFSSLEAWVRQSALRLRAALRVDAGDEADLDYAMFQAYTDPRRVVTIAGAVLAEVFRLGPVMWCLAIDDADLVDPTLVQLWTDAMRFSGVLVQAAVRPSFAERVLMPSALPLVSGQDYSLIKIPRAYEVEQFSRALIVQEMARRGLPHQEPEALFGASALSGGILGTEAARRSAIVARLAERDRSFVEWLKRAGMSADDSSIQQRAQLRSAFATILLRDTFLLEHDGIKEKMRARRWADGIWTGWPVVSRMLEGNPRLILRYLDLVFGTGDAASRRRSTLRQNAALRELHDGFVATLAEIRLPGTPDTVLDLIDRIGNRFSVGVFGKFDPRPPLSFTIDSAQTDSVVDILRLAEDAGAIVPVAGVAGAAATYRLSFLLSPRYRLPPITGRPRPLAQLLADAPQ